MSKLIVVGISDFRIATGDDILITYALGSCIGTCLYDVKTHLAGLSHILLPKASICTNDTNVMKYADTAIEALINKMEINGASRYRLVAKIAGGAKMFPTEGISIGERNIEAVTCELDRLGVRIASRDVGSNYGRTVEFHAEDGSVLIKSVLHGNRPL